MHQLLVIPLNNLILISFSIPCFPPILNLFFKTHEVCGKEIKGEEAPDFIKLRIQNSGWQMKIIPAVFFTCSIFTLVTNSSATEIRERNFKFDDSSVIYQNDPTFVIGNFEKEKKQARPKLVLTLKQKQEGNISEKIEINTPVTQAQKVDSYDSAKPYDAITQCFTKPIYFKFDSSVLTVSEQKKLSIYLDECLEKKTPLVVVGYTCNIGTEKQNQKVANLRADHIKNVLRKNGFNVVEAVGKPKTNFVTDDPKMQYLNRRVVIAKIAQQGD